MRTMVYGGLGSPVTGLMHLRIWDVEHGACAMVRHFNAGLWGRLAMIDSGDAADFRPSTFIRQGLNLTASTTSSSQMPIKTT